MYIIKMSRFRADRHLLLTFYVGDAISTQQMAWHLIFQYLSIQYGFSFRLFWKNWHSGSNNVSDRGTNVRFASKPFLHGGNLSLKSTSVLFSSAFLGHCSSVFFRHGSGVLLRHSRRSNCISIDPFCIPASISQFSTALIILACNIAMPTNQL